MGRDGGLLGEEASGQPRVCPTRLASAEQRPDPQQVKAVKTLPQRSRWDKCVCKTDGVFVDRQMSILHGNKWLEDAKTQSVIRDFLFPLEKGDDLPPPNRMSDMCLGFASLSPRSGKFLGHSVDAQGRPTSVRTQWGGVVRVFSGSRESPTWRGRAVPGGPSAPGRPGCGMSDQLSASCSPGLFGSEFLEHPSDSDVLRPFNSW